MAPPLTEECLKCGEIPIGAVVVDEQGIIIGSGRQYPQQEHDPSAHAEVNAIRQAAAWAVWTVCTGS